MRRRRWRHLIPTFNIIALAIFLSLLLPVLTTGRFHPFPEAHSDVNTGLIGSHNFRLAGRYAIRLLTLSLAVSPLVHLFGWRHLAPLRKCAGLWAYAFALLHVSFFFSDFFWRKAWAHDFTRLGLAALIILTLLALTSHQAAMKRLGHHWKRLHRLVYLAGILVSLHSINGIIAWKEIPNVDVALLETQIYGLQIGALLLLRLEPIRQLTRRLLRIPKRKRKQTKLRA